MGLSLGEKIQTRVGWVILVDGLNEYLPYFHIISLIYNAYFVKLSISLQDLGIIV